MKNDELTFDDLPKLSEEENKWWNEHNDEYIHYFYRIDNISNGKFYYGIHSERKDSGKSPENDGYMGSGTTLNKAQKKEGIKNFKKTIIKTFSTRDEARLEEMKTVNEDLINDPNCYNNALGGGAVNMMTGFVVVNYRDKNIRKNNFFLVTKDEYNRNKDKYITTMFIINRGKAIYKNKKNPLDIKKLSINDPLVLSGEFVGIFSDKGMFKNTKDSSDIRILDLNDPLVLSGEFVGVSKGIKQTREAILKKTGENNGSFGSFWITNGTENRKIKNIEIPDGWKRGRVQIGYRRYRNINTNEEKLFPTNNVPNDFLPSNFFNSSRNIITDEDLYEKHKELGNWIKVGHFFKISNKTVKEILSYYANKKI